MSNPPNPNGANGTTSDPRESVMWEIYVAKLAKGIDNAYDAAIKAGYGKAAAKNITVRVWFAERYDALRRTQMLSKAERNLNKVLDTNYEVELDNQMVVKADVMRIVTDTSKFISQTLGNKHYGDKSKVEHSGDIRGLASIVQSLSDDDKKDTGK